MFGKLGKLISGRWKTVFIGWLIFFAFIQWVSPKWKEVALDGEFDHLPKEMDSIQGEKRFAAAFPDDLLASSIVIVVRREKGELNDNDMAFIEEELRTRLETILADIDDVVINEQLAVAEEELGEEEFARQKTALEDDLVRRLEIGPIPESEITQITSIRSPTDEWIGEMLISEDRQAALVIVGLSEKFLEYGNRDTIHRIETLIARPGGELFEEELIPDGLDLQLSGTATVGRDMLEARDESAAATETWTVGLVILLLILIYRAPLLALIPLITVGIANQVSLSLASLLSQFNANDGDILFGFRTFVEMHVYMTVILYGAGVDYCLFLIARYKEELDAGADIDQAVSEAVGKVGSALTASALTTAFGIGMMVLAAFGKFRDAGIGIALSLIVVLIASLTLTPTLLRLFGRFAFWPHIRSERITTTAGWISGSTLMSKLIELNPLSNGWEKIGQAVLEHPRRLWGWTMAIMIPFAAVGVLSWNHLSYGLMSELPSDDASVVGAKAIQRHFPEGTAGPLTVLLANDQMNFNSSDAKDKIAELTTILREKSDELNIADVRSLSSPFGRHEPSWEGLSGFRLAAKRQAVNEKTKEYYVTQVEGLSGDTTRLDVIFNEDPFSKNSIARLDGVEQVIRDFFSKQDEPLKATHMNFIGSTANIRDLKTTTDRDRIVIDVAVLSVVLVILWILLRRFSISLYLILTVFFSYFVTIGFTYVLFWFLESTGEFAGLDWKVPIFLFTFLIAVGEDYNIYLMTRIDEEQQRRGPIEGIRVALLRTGGIISSCGIIMAGTFSSLVLGGTLKGMQQLGFALMFGVLLDTFVVRPILVPAYLVMLHRGDFGKWTWLLGGGAVPTTTEPESPSANLETPADNQLQNG
ncbi:putative membrane protein YdgH [Symmachiella macrocystis]|uniref:Putative membrane protein YdgH n=1 Tax=Symmachiella macrocystis TaxID=2527985 RepID=A0A5C6BQ11_9PLAN|nr:MMPL family transporter [Symmachiella macrocystis]TWU13782.1 putative membrane protein YdgH [Symmachiella macrocystis]